MMHSSLYMCCFLSWATVAAFAPIAIHTTVRRTTTLLRSGSPSSNDDFVRIFGAEEAAERMRENAYNFVSPRKSESSLQQEEVVSQAGDKEAALLEDTIDAGRGTVTNTTTKVKDVKYKRME
jgi:hypothetical protein